MKAQETEETPRRHGPWKIKGTTRKYGNEVLELLEDEVIKPDGKSGTYAYVKIKEGSAVLALDAEGSVYLAQEFRYALGRESIEVVGGGIDEGETAEEAAQRELKEELGIEADEIISLGRTDPATSLIDSPSSLFLARGLSFKEKENEGTERIKTVKVKFEEAIRMALESEITHSTTCALLFRAEHYLKQNSK